MAEKSQREKTIMSTYAEVQRCEQNGEYERALKATNRILHMAPQETLAFHCKIVCLIELERFEEALQQMKKNSALSETLNFEKAYCHYRLNQHNEALNIIDKVEGELSESLKELKAQILYRLEKYPECVNLYRDIIKNSSDDYDNIHQANLSAALVYLDESSVNEDLNNLGEDTYEVCYNKAYLLAESGQYVEAEKKLRLCEKLYREVLEEDEASEEEIEAALALIKIQLAYIYQKQGRIKEAHQLYTSTLKIKLEDAALVAVASNNVVCINKDQNIFDSKKKIKNATNEQLVHKLPSATRKRITLNSAIFMYYANQYQQSIKLCKSIEENWPELAVYAQTLTAFNLIKLNKQNEAVELLQKTAAQDKANRTYLKLCCAHLYLTEGDRAQACKVLEDLEEDSYKPGIVGALITLYLSLGNEDTALKVFERTVDWYRTHKVKGNLSDMWRQAADFHIKNGHPQVAANSLEELLRSNPNDKKTVAQLVLAYSQFDKQRASELSKRLPDIRSMSGGDLDIESLESSSWFTVKKPAPNKQDSLPTTPRSDAVVEKKKKHKKRKTKLPKNCDPSIPPDPERWLPKYERTGYRKKRDRRAKEVIKGSQGTASGQAEQYDFSSKMSVEVPHESPSDPSPRNKNQQQQQKKGAQKKKNKRR